ncbi:hypothetical protein P171DRAFT_430512 [Karstenula rhodostoma CBS 690.94]|uniref:Uncharacterized protein n=1 Tax=Karstenula rhodostoma CBS 690.94 TaxID=1392251 RepID=A0A9P4PJR0_9PLEO|nr:hypothetical protein P171DRAFT_430512 [Karstenula rhodostoma CBS 690.94]
MVKDGLQNLGTRSNARRSLKKRTHDGFQEFLTNEQDIEQEPIELSSLITSFVPTERMNLRAP